MPLISSHYIPAPRRCIGARCEFWRVDTEYENARDGGITQHFRSVCTLKYECGVYRSVGELCEKEG